MMELKGPFRYRVAISSPKQFEIMDVDGKAKPPPEAQSRLPKLYLVSVNEAPIYVGITKQSIRQRLRLGWAAKGEHGYHGYQWRHDYQEVALDLWCRVDRSEGDPMHDLETIEAEIIFFIRQRGQWPPGQTEIHFHPSYTEHRRIAQEIASRYVYAS